MFLLAVLLAMTPMEKAKKDAETFAGGQIHEVFQSLESFSEALAPEKPLDPEEMKEKVLSGGISQEGTYFREIQSNRSNRGVEDVLFQSEASKNPPENGFSRVKITEAPKPFFLEREKVLDLRVRYKPKEVKDVKKCLGHENRFHFGKIKPFHKDDDPKCNNFSVEKEVVREEQWEILGEEWILTGEGIDSSRCEIYQKQCIDKAPKNIYGKEFSRECWREKLLYKCKKTDESTHQPPSNCKLIEKKCLKMGKSGCDLWEKEYLCPQKLANVTVDENFFGMEEGTFNTDYEKNDSLLKVSSKLLVFDEMKKELEETSEFKKANQIPIFKGKDFRCRKNVLDNVLYDCCSDMGGIAVNLKLAKCSAEEVSLAERKAKGLCHYVGEYSEKFFDIDFLWKSRKAKSYCCFESKLSRVLQEKGRQQLKKGWGSPENPQCQGLTSEEISRLDFEKLDLSEVYDDLRKKVSGDSEKRLKTFQKRLEELNRKT